MDAGTGEVHRDGKGVVLVTGTNSRVGFGRLTAETLARAGYRVFGSMRDMASRNAEVAAELRALGITPIEIDVTDDASVEAGVAEVARATGGRIDVLVNNVGVTSFGVSEALTIAQLQQLFDVNVLSVLRMNRAVLPLMRARRSGLLVHLSSQIARAPIPFMTPYCGAKAAVDAIGEGMRYELSGLGIDSIVVEPGAYPTELMKGTIHASDAATIAAYGPVGGIPQKMGEGLGALFSGPNAPKPQEVADAIHKLVETPAGSRPLRTAVGGYTAPFDAINALTDKVAVEWLGGWGLGDLLKIK